MNRIILLLVAVFLLVGCGADIPQDNLTNAIGSGESQSVVMSGGSTMLQQFYKESGAEGGMFTAVADIVACEAVFEPNDKNGRILLQLRPNDDSILFGKQAPELFMGGGLMTELAANNSAPAESFRASCEGLLEFTALPIKTSNGFIMWLTAVDLTSTVWKAPANVNASEFFSENGYRSILLMTTSSEVDVPETAYAKAYDLNPNDLSAYDLNPNDLSAYDLNPNDVGFTDARCTGVIANSTSNSDIGPIFTAIMFETLIGSSGLVLGDGNALGILQARESGIIPFACEDGRKVQARSADVGLGDAPYHLVELRYPEVTMLADDGTKVLTDVRTMGIALLP